MRTITVVRVELGPLPSGSVLAWTNYGRTVVARLREEPRETPPRLIDAFEGYLDEWAAAARREPVFRWSGTAAPETVEWLVAWLHRVGERIEDDAESGHARLRPPEADRFHSHLVDSVLETLEHEGPAHAQFASELRARWKVVRR